VAEAKIRIESERTTDIYARSHGKAIDQVLNDDWWLSQPHKVIGVTGGRFVHEETVDLPYGKHTVEYAASGYVPNYAWHAEIYIYVLGIFRTLIAEGDVGRHTHLKGTFYVGPLGPLPPPPIPLPRLIQSRSNVKGR